MPRLIDSDSMPMDFCQGCFPSEAEAEDLYKFKVSKDANDGRGCCFLYEDDCHPDYDGTDYECEICSEELTDADNYI